MKQAHEKEIVGQTEEYFNNWIKQVELTLVQGKQIRKDNSDAGPRDELQHWREVLSKYSATLEFIENKAFINHPECLTLSRSKLVKVDYLYFYNLKFFKLNNVCELVPCRRVLLVFSIRLTSVS